MPGELVVNENKLPEAVEQKYQDLISKAKHSAKKRSLAAIRNALADLIKIGDIKLSYAEIGRISAGRYYGPKANTISNATSVHLQALIQCARDNVEKPNKEVALSDLDGFAKAAMPILRDPALNQKLRILLHELKSSRNQLNLLKSDYTKDKEPIQFTVGAGAPIEQNTPPRPERLDAKDVKAIKDFVNSLGDKLGGAGIYENKYGAVEDALGNEIAGVGFMTALRKVLEL